jgi:hypothetical protein
LENDSSFSQSQDGENRGDEGGFTWNRENEIKSKIVREEMQRDLQRKLTAGFDIQKNSL